jgi:SOS-response transcriptional repressor LexA
MRRRLGLTLDELAGRTGISKPYLSLIETGRVTNPPSDEKLRRLERSLGFTPGELLTQAHLLRTPRDVRAMLVGLMKGEASAADAASAAGLAPNLAAAPAKVAKGPVRKGADGLLSPTGPVASIDPKAAQGPRSLKAEPVLDPATGDFGVNLDDAFMSGVLQELVERSAGNAERVAASAVPVVNKVSAGYPADFTDLSYPRGVADDYISCPDLSDKDAFAARVHGDSMTPKYRAGDIVIFSPAAPARNGDDCFVRFDDGHTTFKRVFFESDDANASVIRLQPRNEKYRPQTVPAERITGIYRAIYRYQRVDEE